jgi:GT2 family glycosyltransferase
MSSVSAVIPTWNRADLLQAVLTNLRSQTRRPDQIIVVDNGSEDATQVVARHFGVDLVVFPENRGFAQAVNEGILRATGRWVLILNNDVVLQPDWLERIRASAERENAHFAVGKLLRPGGTSQIDGTWDLVSRAAYAWRCGYGKQDGEIWSTPRRVFFAPMTAALFRREVFDRIGLLETRFESYYEDVDFGVRCALAGVEGIYEPAALALHLSKTTLGRRAAHVYYLTGRNQILILAKYYSRSTLLKFAWPVVAGQILALFAAAKQRNFVPALRGKWDAVRRWKEFRSPDIRSPQSVQETFAASEREIYHLQRKAGFDIYWRLYFSLVRPA